MTDLFAMPMLFPMVLMEATMDWNEGLPVDASGSQQKPN
jgi:hypothetical protein